jgi:hypothetical protein
LATEAMMAPTVKIVKATRRTGFRPIIWEKEAHDGWKTVDARRNDVPAQKASIAVP